jgi:hypothetical protein
MERYARLATGIVCAGAAGLSLLLWRLASWLVANDAFWVEAAKPADVLWIAEGWNVVGVPITAVLCVTLVWLIKPAYQLRR